MEELTRVLEISYRRSISMSPTTTKPILLTLDGPNGWASNCDSLLGPDLCSVLPSESCAKVGTWFVNSDNEPERRSDFFMDN